MLWGSKCKNNAQMQSSSNNVKDVRGCFACLMHATTEKRKTFTLQRKSSLKKPPVRKIYDRYACEICSAATGRRKDTAAAATYVRARRKSSPRATSFLFTIASSRARALVLALKVVSWFLVSTLLKCSFISPRGNAHSSASFYHLHGDAQVNWERAEYPRSNTLKKKQQPLMCLCHISIDYMCGYVCMWG